MNITKETEPVETSTANQELHPREDLSHGDEGIDDPLKPEDATDTTTTEDG